MTKHSKYSELEEILTRLENAVEADCRLRFTQSRSGRSPKSIHLEALTALTQLITKEKAKAELAARFKYEPSIAHAIGYCRSLGHSDSYLEKQFPELAQLTKDKE